MGGERTLEVEPADALTASGGGGGRYRISSRVCANKHLPLPTYGQSSPKEHSRVLYNLTFRGLSAAMSSSSLQSGSVVLDEPLEVVYGFISIDGGRGHEGGRSYTVPLGGGEHWGGFAAVVFSVGSNAFRALNKSAYSLGSGSITRIVNIRALVTYQTPKRETSLSQVGTRSTVQQLPL